MELVVVTAVTIDVIELLIVVVELLLVVDVTVVLALIVDVIGTAGDVSKTYCQTSVSIVDIEYEYPLNK